MVGARSSVVRTTTPRSLQRVVAGTAPSVRQTTVDGRDAVDRPCRSPSSAGRQHFVARLPRIDRTETQVDYCRRLKVLSQLEERDVTVVVRRSAWTYNTHR